MGGEMKKTALALLLTVIFYSAAEAQERKEYIVKRGDTLGEIVFTLRSEGVNVTRLHEWNPDLSTQVQIGQKIIFFTPTIQSPVAVSKEQARLDTEKVIAALKAEMEGIKKDTERRENAAGVMTYLVPTSIFTILLAVVFIVKMKKQPAREEPIAVKATEPEKQDVQLIDPDLPTLRRMALMTGRKRIPFILTLPARQGFSEGPSFPCEAEVEPDPGKKPKVFFPGEKDPIGWEDRRRHAALVSRSREIAGNTAIH
jgi:hypothetical protein